MQSLLLFGIACHRADYRLCWEMNNSLELDLEKQEDYSVEGHSYSMYYFNDKDNYREIFLIANKSDNSFLIPEQKQVDYFLQVYGHLPEEDVKLITSKLNSISIVLTAFFLNPENLKSKQLLIH